jgi:stage IV sporulation protein FB
VFLMEPDRTPYDLRWRMFGTDVRVHPLFWLIAAVFGWSGIRWGPEYVLAFVGVMFVSILLHEFGHVLAARMFGYRSQVVLYSFGGLAIQDRYITSRWQHSVVCFAGPLADFVLAGLAWGLLGAPTTLREWYEVFVVRFGEKPLLWDHALKETLVLNVFWGGLNLIPVWPLDGGQISRDVCTWLNPRSGVRLSLGISFLLAALLALNSLLAQYDRPHVPLVAVGIFGAIMFAMLAIQSFQLMQQAQEQERWADRHREDPWD